MASLPKNIGLLNHLGAGNLGDDATLDAMVENIKRRWPLCEIFAFSMNPSDTQARHGIPSYPIRIETWNLCGRPVQSGVTLKTKVKSALSRHRFLKPLLKVARSMMIRRIRALLQELQFLARSRRIIQSLDLLIISGGGQLLDSSGGSWGFPYTIFKWTVLAKLSHVQCYFVNVGAGPLHHPLSKWFVKRALLLADYASFRDENSRGLIRQIGFTGKAQVVPDCVYSLALSTCAANHRERHKEPVVGFSPMAYCDPRIYWEKDQQTYDRFIQNLASFGSWLSQHNYRLALFSTDIWFDAPTIEDLKTALKADNVESHRITHKPIGAFDELLEQLSSTDYVVTCRFHGVVFAHMLNKPVLAISHHPKVSKLMNDLGLAKYCVDIRRSDPTVLAETFTALVNNSGEIKNRMAEKLRDYRRDLSMQFDQLFPVEAT
jgi:polysaccharide pyruvyl transferase WcaK-like protein